MVRAGASRERADTVPRPLPCGRRWRENPHKLVARIHIPWAVLGAHLSEEPRAPQIVEGEGVPPAPSSPQDSAYPGRSLAGLRACLRSAIDGRQGTRQLLRVRWLGP